MYVKRNTAYYQINYSKQQEKELEDLRIKDEIEKIQLSFPYYGHKSLAHDLKRKGIICNHKRVLRITRKYGMLCQIKKLFKSITDSNHSFPKYPNLIKDLVIESPSYVWAADITYIRLPRGFCYLAVIIDLYSRKIKGWCLSKKLDHSITMEALSNALNKYSAPEYHHSDQGVQYCCYEYTDKLKEHQIRISMSDKGNPYQNAVAESFFKTLKYNEVYLNEYESFEEAFSNIENFIDVVYDKKRLHSSLGYLPPDEFEQEFYQKQHNRQIRTNLLQNEAIGAPERAFSVPR